MIKTQLVALIENTFRREEVLYLVCNVEWAFYTSEEHKSIVYGLVKKVTEAFVYLLDNVYIRFGSKLFRQNVGIQIGTK